MKVTLLSTSDTHGYVYPTDFRKKGQSLDFGLTKVMTKMKEIESKTDGLVLKIDNGDFLQGSPFSYYLAKNREKSSMAAVMNAVGYDCGVLGNHEFNYGLEYLEETIATLNYPIVCANITKTNGEYLTGHPYHIFEKSGVKVAVLGLTTSYIPHWENPETVKDLVFHSVIETAQKFVPQLREEADIVVVSYHGGFERDIETGEATETLTGENEGYALLTEVPGIDVLLTGHQHRVIAENNQRIPITQPGDKGRYLGKVDIIFEKNQGILSQQAELLSMENVQEDSTLNLEFSKILNEVEEWLDQKQGAVNGDMTITDPMAVRLKGHPYIEFIQDVQKEATNTSISGTALFDNNGTGFTDTISMRDIVTNYIYPNTLAVLQLTGKDLRLALERCASYFTLDSENNISVSKEFLEPKVAHFNYDMYSGVEYDFDLKQPVGSRVIKLSQNGKEIAEDDILEVVMNQYRGVGGGDYSMFSADKIIREVTMDMTELISNYLEKHPVIEAKQPTNFNIFY